MWGLGLGKISMHSSTLNFIVPLFLARLPLRVHTSWACPSKQGNISTRTIVLKYYFKRRRERRPLGNYFVRLLRIVCVDLPRREPRRALAAMRRVAMWLCVDGPKPEKKGLLATILRAPICVGTVCCVFFNLTSRFSAKTLCLCSTFQLQTRRTSSSPGNG